MGLRHALDVRLVDHRLVVRGGARRAVGGPLEERVDHDAGHGVAERVDARRRAPPGGQVVGVQVVGEQRLAEVERAVERLAVRVEQQLARVAAVPGRRVPRPVHPEAVALARCDCGQVAVPDVAVDLVEVDALLAAVLADQAEFDAFGDLREQREVGARPVIGGAEGGIGGARPYGGYRGRLVRCHQPTHQPVASAIWRPSSGAWCACRSSRCGERRDTATHFPPPRGRCPCGTPHHSCRAA